MKLVSINTKTKESVVDQVSPEMVEVYESTDQLFELVQYLDGAFVCNTRAMISIITLNFGGSEDAAALVSLMETHLTKLGDDSVNTVSSLVGEDSDVE